MTWRDQGRQYHMWFGHGTAPDKGKTAAPDAAVTGKSIDDRVVAVAYGAIAALPASLRGRAEAQYQRGTLPRLKEAMTAWLNGTRLDQAAFASRFFGEMPMILSCEIFIRPPLALRRPPARTISATPPLMSRMRSSRSVSISGRASSPTRPSGPAILRRKRLLKGAGSRLPTPYGPSIPSRRLLAWLERVSLVAQALLFVR